MTREEAIRELKEDIELYIPLRGTIDDVDRDLPDGRLITALEMAIKALEQEPCEDAISRQEALGCCRNEWEEEVEMRLKSLPPVNPQPKTGHWIAEVDKWGDIVTTVSGYKCSECGEFDSFRDKFCPNCGCRMVEPQESEDKCKNCEYYHNPDYTRCHKCKAESEE